MVFSSVIFLFLFLPVVVGIYFLVNDKVKNVWLLLVSLFFYSWGEPKYIVLMLFSVLFNYVMARWIGTRKEGIWRKILLIASVVINLGLLFYYKYLDFSIDSINRIFHMEMQLKNIALPIGISFYTFQSMSYVIDVYRNKVKSQKNIISLGLYISFFPRIAGPIVRYIDIEEQLKKRNVTLDSVYQGCKLFMIGFSKKVLIADQLAPLSDSIFGGGYSAPSAWIGAIAYAFQIFFDFSGYSDMAIGLGKIFGFEFPMNFNYPYVSKSIKEFWRRWHISLSTWFKDYVYIPLGGSRCSSVYRNYLNLFVVFLLTGIWHGASWNFVVWGLYYVFFLIIERMGFDKILAKLPKALQHIYALFIIVIGWIFFRADSLGSAVQYIKNLFVINQDSIKQVIILMDKQYWFCLLIGVIFSMPIMKKVEELFEKKRLTIILDIAIVFVFVIAISYLLGNGFSPFLYFRF